MRVTSAEVIRNFSKFGDLALAEPIVVTKNGRDRLVILGIDEYNFLVEHLPATESLTQRRTAQRPTSADGKS